MLLLSWHERNKPITPQKGEAKSILVSFQSVRKRLSLQALASTVPFNCPRPESLRHRKGNRDHIVFLELYLYIEEPWEFQLQYLR